MLIISKFLGIIFTTYTEKIMTFMIAIIRQLELNFGNE